MKQLKRMLSMTLAIAMLLTSVWSTPMTGNAAGNITVTVAIEKFVIGQGYLVEPTRVTLGSGKMVSDAFEAVMKQEKRGYELSEYGYYVSGIEDKNRGEIQVSETIKTALQGTLDYNGNPLTLTEEDYTPDMLGSYDYCSYAGWMYCINDSFNVAAMNETEINDGDVIRIQFSLMGGADIDPTEYDWSTPVYPEMPNRTQITKIFGHIHAQLQANSGYLAERGLEEDYETAHQMVVNLETTKEEMAQAEEMLPVDLSETILPVVTHRTSSEVDTIAKNAIANIVNTKKNAYGNEWTVITLKRAGASGCTDYYNSYLKNLKSTVKKNKGLPNGKPTDYARVSIALTALGKNPTKYEGYNLLKPLADYKTVTGQGINGAVYALIALDCGRYNMPSVASTVTKASRTKYIDFILSKQLEDGGFTFYGTQADPDMTAMTITSLAPYYHKYDRVRKAVDCAVDCLSKMQLGNGSFESYGSCNAESNAQVVLALSTLGINPRVDERFVKNGNSVVDALVAFSNSKGAFKHTMDGKTNTLASIQATYALVAYTRMVNWKSPLFQMK